MTGVEIAKGVNEIIRGIDKDDFRHAAINWGDLKCNSIEVCQEVYPQVTFSYKKVIIDEADPQNGKFCIYIRSEFKKRFHEDIMVVTEW